MAKKRALAKRTLGKRSTGLAAEPFRLIVDSVVDYAILMLDPKGHVVTWNAGAERIKGYSAQEIVGRHFSKFYPSEDVSSGKPERELEIAADKGRLEDEGWRVRKDGTRFWANVIITALRDKSGALVGFGKVTRDLTQRRKAEEKFRGLLEAAPDAMVIADPKGLIVLVNAQAESLFGYARGEMLGRPVEILLPERYRGAHVAQRDGYFHAPRPRAMGAGKELVARRKDGSEFPVEISLSPLETEEGTLAMSAIRDVTERKKTENELLRLNGDLTLANTDLEAFSSSIAHDLRAPIRQMHGFAQLLLEDFGPKIDVEMRRHLDRIMDGARRMGIMIDALLRLSRIGRQTLARQTASLDDIVRAAQKEVEQESAGRDVDWRLGELGSAQCDPELLRQVFVNLLSNALKYSRPRARAVVEIGREAVGAQTTYFVRDNGVGFDMKHASKLFGIFSRLHSQEEFEGTGIGLATVGRILRNHGGRIWPEAEPDHGATFYFTLGG